MLHLLAFLLFLFPSNHIIEPTNETALLTCPEVSGLQKTGETTNSISYTWNDDGAEYKLWYTRAEDNYTSSFFYAYSTNYSFTGLSAGSYTFYFQALCGAETSGYIGVEDIIGN
ncbi:MAG: hypothetical protein ACKVT2_10105 [Saprospiraceae bacterium]